MIRQLLLWTGTVGVIVSLALAVTAVWSPWDEVRKVRRETTTIGEPGSFAAERDWIPGLTVRLVRNGIAWAIDDHFLYVSADSGRTFERRGEIGKEDPGPVDRIKNRIARHPLMRRVRENRGPSSVVVLESGTVLLFYDRVYRSVDGGWTFQRLPPIDDEFYGPFPHGVAVDSEDRVFFGEYRTDARPHPVRIYRGVEDGSRWEACHTFDPGEVFHVHSLLHDPFQDRVLVSTGDRDEESWLFELDEECGGVSPVGGGDQRWRLIAPIFRADAMFWANDNDIDGSAIFRLSRGTDELVELGVVGRPSYHASLLSDGTMALSTTHEPESPWAKASNPSAITELWISETGTEWQVLDRATWNEQVVSWGPTRAVFRLPASDGSLPYLFASPESTTEPFGTYRYMIEWGSGGP